MNYSAHVGRVGALAVALGVGAAVAAGPGLAFAEETESETPSVGVEAPAEPADDVETTVADENDTSAEPDTSGVEAELEAELEAEFEEEFDGAPEPEEPEVTVPDEQPSDHEFPPSARQVEEPPAQEEEDEVPVPDPVDPPTVNAPEPSFGALAAFDSPSAEANEEPSVGTLPVVNQAPAPSNPLVALFTAPLRIVGDVLAAFTGGGTTPTGENPLFAALLAFVRRPFDTFSRTFANQAPVISAALVVENEDGTFTITTDASDPDGDPLTISSTNGEDGTVTKTGTATFVYTPPADWDGEDTLTLTASDPGGLFGFNRKSATFVVTIAGGQGDPTQPEVTVPPTVTPDGKAEAEFQFDPEKVTNVTVAPGFEPRYWNVTETYDPETGRYEVVLTPTQAGQLRAALGLDTTDTLGLQVTTTDTQTMQPLAFRMASFAAPAGPDYTVNLPDIPAGHFEVGDPIATGATDPAGVVVTKRYAYVVNTGPDSSVSVIGADPDEADYRQVVAVIPVGQSATVPALVGESVYVIDGLGFLTVIDTTDNTASAPVDTGVAGGAFPVVSPDQTRLYVVNPQLGYVAVLGVDPADTATYQKVIATIEVADEGPQIVVNDDGSITVTAQLPMAGVLNGDGTRLYVVRDNQTYVATPMGTAEFSFTSELVIIDTSTSERVGDPVPLGDVFGYFPAGDGEFLYIPTMDLNGFVVGESPDVSSIIGGVTVVDVRDADNPVILAELPAGVMPMNVALSPDKSLAYVVDGGTGTIWLIDTANQEVLDLDPAPSCSSAVTARTPWCRCGSCATRPSPKPPYRERHPPTTRPRPAPPARGNRSSTAARPRRRSASARSPAPRPPAAASASRSRPRPSARMRRKPRCG